MLDELIVRHSAPTLAGIKCANLFSVNLPFNWALSREVANINKKLMDKNIRLIPLVKADNRTLLYIYRPEALKKELNCSLCKSYLKEMGYCADNPDVCVKKLINRLENSDEFLHEIGFFLGYPAEDVIGFIEQGAKASKISGLWKVYSDVARAKKMFKAYKVCTDIYYNNWQKGVGIERLAIAANA